MIERLLPSTVVCQEFFGEQRTGELLAEEAPLVARAVDSRRLEFATGRACARKALAELGFPESPILSGPKREPLWPAGVRGSITHCRGYVAAAVTRADDLAVLGIDAEPHDALPDGVLGVISLPEERARLAEQSGGPHWDRVLFSAKESLYKAWFPLTGRWLGFEDAVISFDGVVSSDPAQGSFVARLRLPPEAVPGAAPTGFTGRFLCADGLVLTAVTAAVVG